MQDHWVWFVGGEGLVTRGRTGVIRITLGEGVIPRGLAEGEVLQKAPRLVPPSSSLAVVTAVCGETSTVGEEGT